VGSREEGQEAAGPVLPVCVFLLPNPLSFSLFLKLCRGLHIVAGLLWPGIGHRTTPAVHRGHKVLSAWKLLSPVPLKWAIWEN
jgi:hypothetical protein